MMNEVAQLSNKQPIPMMRTILVSLACYTLLIPCICAQPSGGDPFFRPPPSDDDRLSDDVLFNRLIVAVHANNLEAVSELVYRQIDLIAEPHVGWLDIQTVCQRQTQQGKTLLETAISLNFWSVAAYLANYYWPPALPQNAPEYPRWFRCTISSYLSEGIIEESDED